MVCPSWLSCILYNPARKASTDRRRIMSESKISGKSVVLEVGAGNGFLTEVLAEHAAKVGADAFSAVPPSYFKISSVDIFLLMTSLSLWLPASGAIVKPVFRTRLIKFIRLGVNVPARSEGRETAI